MLNLNVFNWPYSKKYYLTHPWKWVGELFRNIRDAYHRARYGWCYMDVWNFSDWFCAVVPPMLYHMSEYSSGYPGVEPFETPEKWSAWLHKMASTIERLGYDEWLEDNNEYSEAYERTFDDDNSHIILSDSPDKEETRKLYYARCKELIPEREKVLKKVFEEWASVFDRLWD